jgi:hypothetical protein
MLWTKDVPDAFKESKGGCTSKGPSDKTARQIAKLKLFPRFTSHCMQLTDHGNRFFIHGTRRFHRKAYELEIVRV